MAKSTRAQQTVVPELSLVFAYYENPQMLALQWDQIAAYPAEIKAKIEVVVVDDASPTCPAHDVERPAGLPAVSIYRISNDIRWNQDAARNIGAFEARSPWLLLTDIDHVVPAGSLTAITSDSFASDTFYTLGRIKFYGGQTRDSHPNSYLISKNLYWTIGGHDEDFAGIYGKDFLFRKRAKALALEMHRADIVLARVGSSHMGDAGTTTISRKNSFPKRVWGYVLEWLKRARLWRGVQTLKHPYERMV